MPKIVVIGIDSATFDIIEPLVNQGKLPVFTRFMKEGVWGRLQSTIPPVTPPAWTSLVTGKNPGKHGIFDFYGYTTNGYERPIINSQAIKAKTLWNILSEGGKSVGIINVPLTYPPEKVNGFLIPGMQY
ncbi:MAG: alkaline phosphatase family protein, partial [Candidatus Brocadiales bacterium]|nr:alkaline phosphatase family protein [Candidatus Brocadiales bacterium]